MSDEVTVLGGGLAGIAAAVRLAECGVRVTLIETRQRLGGRATSFVDPQSGHMVDNCQHVLMGCCTNLIDLYARLGTGHLIRWHDRLHFGDKRGHRDVLQRTGLPAPLHLSGLVSGFKTLNWEEKLAIARGMMAMMGMSPDDRARCDAVTFEKWLIDHGQPRGAIDKFWSVVIISALNEHPARASAAYAIMVFQDGFLAHRDAYLMGTSTVPLLRLYDRAVEVIEKRGGRVLLGTSIEGLDYESGRIDGVRLAGGRRVTAEAGYLSALPFDRLEKISTDAMKRDDPRLTRLGEFRVSPILGIHMWYDLQVMDLPHLIFVDSPLQWVFNKGKPAEEDVREDEAAAGAAQYLHGVISAADDWVDQKAEAIGRMADEELRAYFPVAADAKLVHCRVIKEKRATFSVAPGVEAIRPRATGSIENLYLAGDWCDTGWPATMEGAVRSGYAAAGALLGERMIVDDLQASVVYRALRRVLA